MALQQPLILKQKYSNFIICMYLYVHTIFLFIQLLFDYFKFMHLEKCWCCLFNGLAAFHFYLIPVSGLQLNRDSMKLLGTGFFFLIHFCHIPENNKKDFNSNSLSEFRKNKERIEGFIRLYLNSTLIMSEYF